MSCLGQGTTSTDLPKSIAHVVNGTDCFVPHLNLRNVKFFFSDFQPQPLLSHINDSFCILCLLTICFVFPPPFRGRWFVALSTGGGHRILAEILRGHEATMERCQSAIALGCLGVEILDDRMPFDKRGACRI